MDTYPIENLFYFADGVERAHEEGLNRFLGGLSASINWVDTRLNPLFQVANFRDVISVRAIDAFKRIDQPIFLEEEGVVIRKLGGFPGTLTDFVIGIIGLSGIDCLVEGMASNDFRCQVISFSAYMDESLRHPELFWSVLNGTWRMRVPINRRGKDDSLWHHIVLAGFHETVATMINVGRQQFETELAAVGRPHHLLQLRRWLIETGRVSEKK